MDCDLIIKGKYLLPMNEKMQIIEDGAVVIVGDVIKETGKAEEIEKKFTAKEIIDIGFGIVMPGMINTHTHSAMVYFRGLADDLPLDEWLNNYIWPAEAKYIKPNFVRSSSELACLEMIKSGITCFNDMYFFEEELGKIASKAGMRAVLGEAILDFPAPSYKNTEEAWQKIEKLIKQFKDDNLIKIALAPHSIYTCSKETLLRAKDLADKFNLSLHIHISETKKEVEEAKQKFGKSPVEYLAEIGFLSDRVNASHSVWLSDNDLNIFQAKKVKVNHCPVSNMKLASGVAVLPKMLDRGITVGLGTDSAASNNTLDLFFDMRVCALLHKVNNFDPALVSSQKIVEMVTIDGARVLGLDSQIGSLETGKKADVITIDLNKPHLLPIHNPYSHLVYCANSEDVDNVIINGKVIMRDRKVKTLNEESTLKEAQKFKFNG